MKYHDHAARVHQTDDARVGEIRKRQVLRGNANDKWYVDDIDYLLSLLPQLSSNDRCCGECGHGDSTWNPVTAVCEFDADPENESVLLCGCKCVFPATDAAIPAGEVRARAQLEGVMNCLAASQKEVERLNAEVARLTAGLDDKASGIIDGAGKVSQLIRASRANAIDKAIEAAKGEHLLGYELINKESRSSDDRAYDQAVNDVVAALEALKEKR